jgi:putative cardiolipin synthase
MRQLTPCVTCTSRNLLLFAIAMAGVGCSSLKPVDLAPEFTDAPATAEIWGELNALRPGDWFALLNDGATALDWRLRAIDSATASIDLQTFLWSFDTVGALVLDHLVAAADRGVQIKLLVDDSFLLGEDQVLIQLHRHPNIEYRVFNPYKRRSSGFASREALNLSEYHRLDHRMHNKSMIVDNRVAIVGGRNLADEYFGIHSQANFRDLEIIAGGPIVTEVSQAFDGYWNDPWSVPMDMLSHIKSTPADLAEARRVRDENLHLHTEETTSERLSSWENLIGSAVSGKATLYVDRPPQVNPANENEAPVQVADELMDILDNAADEVLIVSAYLIPTIELEAAVERAVARGVRVRVLTNSIRSNNHLSAHSAYRNHIEELLNNGAELHEVRIDARDREIYMLSPVEEKALALHAKALVIDQDKIFIGSANLDPRSLRINTEMGFLVESEALNAQLRNAMTPDFEGSNAWNLQFDENGKVIWVSDDRTLSTQPAGSFMQRIEDWFFSHLPIEDEL